jgi:hypothetical protein
VVLASGGSGDVDGWGVTGCVVGAFDGVLVGVFVGGADVGGSDVGGSDVGGSDVGGSDVGGSDVGGSEVGGSDVGGSDVGGADVGGASVVGGAVVGSGDGTGFLTSPRCGAFGKASTFSPFSAPSMYAVQVRPGKSAPKNGLASATASKLPPVKPTPSRVRSLIVSPVRR